METYHGTSTLIATTLASGGVNVTLGGGELGRGFYTGEYLHKAKAWAFHRYRDKQYNVVQFSHSDNDIVNLTIKLLDYGAATLKRSQIRQANQTRTFLFNVDMVWSPIVGSKHASEDQYKWESQNAQGLLNGPNTTKVII